MLIVRQVALTDQPEHGAPVHAQEPGGLLHGEGQRLGSHSYPRPPLLNWSAFGQVRKWLTKPLWAGSHSTSPPSLSPSRTK